MKGMVELPAVAVFTIAAGSLIVLFFVVMANNQADTGKRDIEIASLERFDSLITSAATARETESNITVIDETLLFVCDDVSTRIEYESRISKDLRGITLFAPHRLTGGQLKLYSRGVDVPYRMGNVLYATTDTYAVSFTGDNEELIEAYKKDAPKNFVADDGVRKAAIVKNKPAQGTRIQDGWVYVYQEPGKPYGTVFYDDKTTAYYANAEMFYGAILSDDSATYNCVMRTHLANLRFSNAVLQKRAQLLAQDASPQCKPYYYQSLPFETVERVTQDGKLGADELEDLTQAQAQLAFINDNLLRGDNCATIY